MRGELFTLTEALIRLVIIGVLLEALRRFVLPVVFVSTVDLSVDVTTYDVRAFCLAMIIIDQVQDVHFNVMFVSLM